jgi:hypothetical protein
MKFNQKDAIQTEDKATIKQSEITFHTKGQTNPSLSVAVHPAQISLTCRHP